MTPKYEGLLKDQQLAIGVADVQDLNVESPYTLVERINDWGGSGSRRADAHHELLRDEPPLPGGRFR